MTKHVTETSPGQPRTSSTTPSASAEGAPPTGTASLRRNRNFMLLWTGQVVSSVGSSVAVLVYPLLALAATGSPAQAGIVGSVGVGVGTLLLLPAGAWVDRYRVKPLLIGCDVVRAATTASIAIAVVTGTLTLAHLILAAAISSACGALFTSAHTVAIRHVVPAEHLPTALAQDEARGYIAKLTGQPVGGYLYAISPALPVGVDALSFLFGGALTALIRLARRDESANPGERTRQLRVDGHRRASMRQDMRTGLVYVWSSTFLRTTLLCSIGINAVFAGLTLAIVAAATQHGTQARPLGIAFGIGAVGGILGAVASHRIQNRLRPSTLIYCFGWTVTAALLALGTIHLSYAVGAILAAVYFVTTPANAMLFAAQIHLTPPELQGRVVSAALLTIGVATPLGPLMSGYLIEHTGQTLTFTILAAVVAACTITMQTSTAIRTTPRPGR